MSPPPEASSSQEHRDGSPRRPGYFVVVEGIDGTGKSTLVEGLARTLRERGITCVTSREPTDGPHGRKIRELAKSGRYDVSPEDELALFIEDRKEHLDRLIKPGLGEGKVVILDRYFYSSMAYQGARGLDPAVIRARHLEFAPEPDLLVILELDVERSLERIHASRESGADEFEGREYLGRVAAVFDGLVHPNLLRLDAGLSREDLVGHVVEAMGTWLEARG